MLLNCEHELVERTAWSLNNATTCQHLICRITFLSLEN
jgi:hypothetical protein